MRLGRYLLASFVALSSSLAHADTFALSAFFESNTNPPGYPVLPIGAQVNGFVTINTVTGEVTSVSATVREDFSPHHTETYVLGGPGYMITQSVETFPPGYGGLPFPVPPVAYFDWTDSNGPGSLTIFVPVSSFVGYAGGSLCAGDSCYGPTSRLRYPNFPGSPYGADNDQGTLTLVSSDTPVVTPEPSSLLLLSSGIASLSAVLRRRLGSRGQV